MADESWWQTAPLAPPATEDKWWETARPVPTPLIPSATPEQGSILPFRRGAKGPEFDPNAGILGSLLRGLTTPGDVYRGAVPTPYETGVPNPDLTARGIDTAGVMSPMSPAYRAGSRFGTVSPLDQNAWLAGRRGNLTTPPPPAPPSAQEIADTARGQFKSIRRSGWEVPSSEVEEVARSTQRELRPDFVPPSLTTGPGDAPRTYGRLERMTEPEYSATSVAELKSHYDALSKTIAKGGPDAEAAYTAREAVANIINNLEKHGARAAPGTTPTMTPGDVASTFETARGNWRAAQGANQISGELTDAVKGILETVEAKAAATGNYNVDAPLRMRALAILQDKASVAAMGPEAKAALEGVVQGTAPRNFLRDFGRRFGSDTPLGLGASGGMGGTVGAGAGAMLGGPVGAVIGGGIGAAAAPIAGGIARKLARGGTERALSAVEELMRGNSPLAQSILENQRANFSPGAGNNEVLMRLLMPGLLSPLPPLPAKTPGYI